MEQRAKERVNIAKDALAWIKAEALLPTNMVYLKPDCIPNPIDSNKQLRDVFLGTCKVCALGALFLAKAVRYDNVLAGSISTSGAYWVKEPLTDHFDENQIRLIEVAFEGWGEETKTYINAYNFSRKYPNIKDRLVAILKNIIKNKGTFIP